MPAAGDILVYRCGWINPPHDKIAICIQAQPAWVFWFNTNAQFHGYGQLLCDPTDHPAALTRQCYLDLSGLKVMQPSEIAAALSRGVASPAFRAKIKAALQNPIKTLPDSDRLLVLANL
jgi:hypothetical protein